MSSEKISQQKALEIVKGIIKDTLDDRTNIFKDVFDHLLTSEGKYIRTKLGIICASKNDGGKYYVEDKFLPLLAAVELLHLATLIHDDVIDEATTRRNIQAVHKKFDNKTAVLSGDYIFTLCFSLVSKDDYELMPNFSKVMSLICQGELLQHKNRFNYNISVKDYFKIISGKTAALFALSSAIGARGAGYNDKEIKNFAEVGYRLGVLFQITDDKIDIEEKPYNAGKDTQNDFKEGIYTLPVILALKKLREDLKDIKDLPLYLEYGSKRAKEVVEKYKDKTIKAIEKLPKEADISSLYDILDKILNRRK
mgnify:FL=1